MSSHQFNFPVLKQRAVIVQAIRDFFRRSGFWETETPQLVPLPSMEPYLEVFETQLLDQNRQPTRAFLISSPEYAMKQMLAAGSGNIFQITKSFRNAEGVSPRHNPEFSILEWYRVGADYLQIMDDCEQLLKSIAKTIHPDQQPILEYQGEIYNLAEPWERITVSQAFKQYAQIDRETLLTTPKLLAASKERGYQVNEQTTWEEVYNQIFLNEIEPNLGKTKPTIIYEYPVSQAALSKKKKSDPRFAERFEFYINGLELGNAFSELTDWQEQLNRLKEDQQEKARTGRTLFDIDYNFINALKSGLPECAGIAVGVDRLVMLFTDQPSIQETLAFPATHLWPELIK